jgi:hypothetical protein
MKHSSLLAALLLQAAPRRWLLARLRQSWPTAPAGARCVAWFSGRVALAQLARHPSFTRRVALLPAYLCNVVPMAFERAGWRVCTYAVDDRFVPDPQALRELAEKEGAELLLLAPLYGSEGGLAYWLGAQACAWRATAGVTLVLDLCQDAARLQQLPHPPARRWAAVLSFNDKSFPGVMGACLWTDLDLDSPPPPRWWRRLLLVGWALSKSLAGRRRNAGEEAFEHSRGERFPYAFDETGASALQLAFGLVGMARLPRWVAARRAAVERGDVRPLPLPFSAGAPFVVAAADDPARHRRKRPYATAHDPQASLLPQLVVVHNKGFDDR